MANVARIIHEATQARPSGYQFMPRYRSGMWDGYIRLTKGSKFPTGLLSLVIDNLRAQDIYQIETLHYTTPDRSFDVITPEMFAGIMLRPYQIGAARTLLAFGRGIAKMATNSGKTEIMAAMAKAFNGKVIVLTTKKDLLHQTATRLENRLQEQTGIIGDGCWEPKRVTVATIQTLVRYLGRMRSELGDLDVVMYDECHHESSKTSQEVMLSLDAPCRYGFSGTPLVNDKLSDLILIGATGPVLVEVTNAQLIKQGISAEPLVEMYSVEGNGVLFDTTWSDAYSELIVKYTQRNQLLAKVVKRKRARSTLILVERIEHGKLLQQALPGSTFVNGGSPMEQRKAILDELRKGLGAIVIATPIFDEGIDVPAVSLLVLAGGGKSPKNLLQRLGRGMRRKADDNFLHVVDFVDDTNKHLLQHSLERARVYEQEGFRVEIIE